MKRALIIILFLFVLIAAVGVVAPSYIDWSKYKTQIVQRIEAATGYQVSIGGDLQMAFLPVPHAKIGALKIASPLSTEHTHILALDEADVTVALLPLLKGKIEVDHIKLVRPDIRLEVLKDGRPAWMTKRVEAQKGAAQPSQTTSSTVSKQQNISLGKLDIDKGRFEYLDHRTGKVTVLQDISGTLRADTLMGPYHANGSFLFDGKEVAIDAKTTDKLGKILDSVPVSAQITLAKAGLKSSFSGIVALQEPFEVQGESSFEVGNLKDLSAVTGNELPALLHKNMTAKGFVTAGPDGFVLKDAAFSFGGSQGSGYVSLSNLNSKNPVKFDAAIDLKGVLDLDVVADKPQKTAGTPKGRGGAAAKPAGFLPKSLSLPFQADGHLALSVESAQIQGQSVKGIMLDVTKAGQDIKVQAKAMDIPGKGKIDHTATLRFASSSVSEKDGSVTYADPVLSFRSMGRVDQLPTLLRGALNDKADNPALEHFRSAEFDVSGTVSPAKIALKDSVVKLDKTTFGISGSYIPGSTKPLLDLDLTADNINFDEIVKRQQNSQRAAVQAQQKTAQKSVQESLQPLRDLELPVDLNFDLSLQKARIQGTDIAGIRIKGKSKDSALLLQSVSVNDIYGATVKINGKVDDLKTLSGVDVNLEGRTADAQKLAQALKMDTAALPKSVGGADAKLSLKGKAEALSFVSSIQALNGQLDVSGDATNILEKLEVSNIAVGIKHPNLAQAVQMIAPDFKTGGGLNQKVDFYTKAVRDGDVYAFEGLKATIGPTSVAGTLKADISGDKPTITGALQLGQVPLDAFMGAAPKRASAGLQTTKGTVNKPSSSNAQRWSRDAIETAWMHQSNFDFDVKAKSVTHGGWQVTNPAVQISLKDGSLQLKKLTGGLFGGQVDLSGVLQSAKDPKQPLSLQAKSSMTNVGIEALSRALSGAGLLKADGNVSLAADIQTIGLSPFSLVGSLKGSAKLDGKDVTIEGFDLARMARGLSEDEKIGDSLEGILGASFEGGRTQFDTVTGSYVISEGVLQTGDTVLDGPAAQITTSGAVNLPRWNIDLTNQIALKGADDVPPFTVSIKGPLDNPVNTFGQSLLQDYINRKIQRKINKELENVLGGLLGAPKSQPQQAAPQQAQPSSGQPQQPQQQPKQQQQEITPEQAIQGVLEGLFGQ